MAPGPGQYSPADFSRKMREAHGGFGSTEQRFLDLKMVRSSSEV